MPSFVFQYRSFTVCLPTVGPEMALSSRHILPLNIDMSGRHGFGGVSPFPGHQSWRCHVLFLAMSVKSGSPHLETLVKAR